MKYSNDFDCIFLRSVISYDHENGELRWLERDESVIANRSWNAKNVGKICGLLDHQGYRRIKINGKKYAGHRLSWLHYYGVWPTEAIDHINLNKSDNRTANLREANWSSNCANTPVRPDNKVGLKGVCLYRTGKFRAQIKKNGKVVALGYFDRAEDAHHAYVSAAREKHGIFARG